MFCFNSLLFSFHFGFMTAVNRWFDMLLIVMCDILCILFTYLFPYFYFFYLRFFCDVCAKIHLLYYIYCMSVLACMSVEGCLCVHCTGLLLCCVCSSYELLNTFMWFELFLYIC